MFGVTIFLINGPWKDPKSLNFPAAAYVGEEVFLSIDEKEVKVLNG